MGMIVETKPIVEQFGINLYTSCIPEGLDRDVNYVIKTSGLDEPFDYENSKYFIVAKNGDDVIGLVVYGEIIIDGLVLPRFLHIIIAPHYKRSKLAYKMLLESEQELKKLGYKIIVCFIRFDLESRIMKKTYAEKWGYKKYSQNKFGEFFYKNIKERN